MTDYLTESDQKRGVQSITRNLTRWIRWVAGGLVILFGFLEISNAPIDKITEAFDSNSFTKFGLFMYFTGWAFGATDDTKIQKTAYALDPQGGKVGMMEWSGIFVFIIFFTSLFLLHTYTVFFQISILIFVIINMWTYSYVIMKRANIIINESKNHYISTKDYIRYLKLYCAIEYLTGGWQKRRFISLLIIAIVQLIVAILIEYTNVVSSFSGYSVKNIPVSNIIIYLPSLLFIIYVIISEGWMKIYRYKVFSDFDTIDEIGEHFRISKNPKLEFPPINTENLFRRSVTYHDGYS